MKRNDLHICIDTYDHEGFSIPVGTLVKFRSMVCRKTGYTPETVPDPAPDRFMEKGFYGTLEIIGGARDGEIVEGFFPSLGYEFEECEIYDAMQSGEF